MLAVEVRVVKKVEGSILARIRLFQRIKIPYNFTSLVFIFSYKLAIQLGEIEL